MDAAFKILGNRATLPVLPASARQIIETASDEFVELTELATRIEQDPVIAARIVGLANSAYFQPPCEITSVEAAVIKVLGLDIVRGIAIGMAFDDVLESSLVPEFDRTRYWNGSLTTSLMSKTIASSAPGLKPNVSLCSLNGLLANLGLLVIAALQPRALQKAIDDEDGIDRSLRCQIGCSHLHVTAALSELWELPQATQSTMLELVRVRQDEPHSPLLACLRLASAARKQPLESLQESHTWIERLCKMIGIEGLLSKIDQERSRNEDKISLLASSIG